MLSRSPTFSLCGCLSDGIIVLFFLEIFLPNDIVSISPCVSIKASLLAVITGI